MIHGIDTDFVAVGRIFRRGCAGWRRLAGFVLLDSGKTSLTRSFPVGLRRSDAGSVLKQAIFQAQ